MRFYLAELKACLAICFFSDADFIRAEVMALADLQQLGSETAVKAAGKWRLEGKDYPVQDGDILQVRFSPPVRK